MENERKCIEMLEEIRERINFMPAERKPVLYDEEVSALEMFAQKNAREAVNLAFEFGAATCWHEAETDEKNIRAVLDMMSSASREKIRIVYYFTKALTKEDGE